ncbi:hypothetical protein D3C76_1770070 [compost metagenome]
MEFATGTESSMQVRHLAPLPAREVPDTAPSDAGEAATVSSQVVATPVAASPRP